MSSVFLSHSQISHLSVYDFRLGNELLESKCSECICYLFPSKKFPQNLMFKTINKTTNIFHLTDLTTSAVQGFRSGLVGWLRLESLMKQSRCQVGLQSSEGLTEAEKSTFPDGKLKWPANQYQLLAEGLFTQIFSYGCLGILTTWWLPFFRAAILGARIRPQFLL